MKPIYVSWSHLNNDFINDMFQVYTMTRWHQYFPAMMTTELLMKNESQLLTYLSISCTTRGSWAIWKLNLFCIFVKQSPGTLRLDGTDTPWLLPATHIQRIAWIYNWQAKQLLTGKDVFEFNNINKISCLWHLECSFLQNKIPVDALFLSFK